MKDAQSNRLLNFGAGPAALPQSVLEAASEAVVDYRGSGMSVLEIPHRGKLFDEILEESQWLVKHLCGLNDDYEVLWLHGGGRLQFSMLPMNFLGADETAGYIDSGYWADEAMQYAGYYGSAQALCSSKSSGYKHLPELPAVLPPQLAYMHLTTNNTIVGTQWADIPQLPALLIADMSSDIFSRNRAYENCAMFYAVAQKNLGAAGATLVVLRKDLLKKVRRELPPMLAYQHHVKAKSVLNTPPVFAVYTALLMLRWTNDRTIAALEQESIEKAALLYNEIERNPLFTPTVSVKEHRSRMNICFAANNTEIEKGFSEFCTRQHITGIEGHRTVGGFRVSLYNAITVAQVKELVAVMQEFEIIS